MTNPLLAPWSEASGLPPFAAVGAEHFMPAFVAAMAEQMAEIDAIAAQTAAPTFADTIAALDRSGSALDRVASLFFNLAGSETSPALQAVEREVAPLLAAHGSRLHMHAGLFARIDALHAERAGRGLGPEEVRVLERFHTDFVRAGAKLGAAAQKRYAEVVERLAELTTRFGQNVLADESAFRLVLESEAELAGLPEFVRAAAAEAARERGLSAGTHVITLSRSHIVPFLTFSDRRDLREQAWRAWTSRGEHEGSTDNRQIAAEILSLRAEQARLHGYGSYADYALADTMAKSQEAVTDLLLQVWEPAKGRALRERAALVEQAAAQGETAPIEPWDWRYYAERVRRRRYDLDEAAIKPYFVLERMVEAAFDCAQRLFGIGFTPRPELRVYHPDVKVYEARRSDGSVIGLFLHDNFARPSKRSGAWMSSYRVQSKNVAAGAAASRPIIVNNNNFAKAAAGSPTLLSFDDARTLFHEFGHGLHGLLSDVTYRRVAGTSVLRDFVELPSQLFEHWLEEPAVLKKHARHCISGEPIPDALIDRLRAARHFNQGYETVRYTGSALVDMAAHARSGDDGLDVVDFERQVLERLGLPEGIGINHRLTHFQHLFSGSGYAAGYYVYLWAEVLEADGFEAFVEAGDPFDAEVASRLLRYVYSAGNSLEPGAAYRSFRGRAATAEPMLKGRGLLEPADA
ncbi:MAG: M3 family metallopeptidase [Pseudomonadota bacterium]|nr:M3 family metallopeptidase [Pseudomonadota bacterium]